jgi:hypothetical protein
VVWGDRASDGRMDRLATDRDGAYGDIFLRRVRSTARRLLAHHGKMRMQNGLSDRSAGNCLDQSRGLVNGISLTCWFSYMSCYNGTRTHLSLNNDALKSRAAETAGRILCRPILGGLHHQYVRIQFVVGTRHRCYLPLDRSLTVPSRCSEARAAPETGRPFSL